MKLSDTIDLVKQKRSVVNINPNFFKQLIDFEILVHGSPSMRIIEVVRDTFTIEKIEQDHSSSSDKKKRKREKKLKKKEKREKKEKTKGTLKLKDANKKQNEEQKISVKKDKFCW